MNDTNLLPLSETEVAYLAGLIDGEGCIRLQAQRTNKGKYYSFTVSMSIAMVCNPCPLPELHDKLGGTLSVWDRKKDGWKDCYRWALYGAKLVPLLQAILPYLKVKHKQCVLAIQYLNWRATYGRKLGEKGRKIADAFHQKFLALNKRGRTLQTTS